VDEKGFRWDRVASGRETSALVKASHRGHGGRRGGIGVVDKRLWVDRVASGRETRALVKASHRGHGGRKGGPMLWTRKALGGQGGFWPGNERIGEGIAERSRRSQRGDLVGTHRNSIGNTVASGRRNWLNGKASHRGHRGGFGLVPREFYLSVKRR
jgi:hypothetical protein